MYWWVQTVTMNGRGGMRGLTSAAVCSDESLDLLLSPSDVDSSVLIHLVEYAFRKTMEEGVVRKRRKNVINGNRRPEGEISRGEKNTDHSIRAQMFD